MQRLLFIGDVVGNESLNLVCDLLPLMRRDLKTDFCIVNGENADNGKGINSAQVKKLKQAGADVITGGNHIWQRNGHSILNDPLSNLIRPANYPEGAPGKGLAIIKQNNSSCAVINLQGRSFMPPIDCPFKKADKLLKEIDRDVRIVFVDFHAEASAEKQALGWYLDGKVSACVGTHTHVQTADERILPNGTAFITDAGMSGPIDSVIGMQTSKAIERFISQLPVPYHMANKNYRVNGVLIEVNEKTGKSFSIKRLNFSREEYGNKNS